MSQCNNPTGTWEEGDIAYLRPSAEYTIHERHELIDPVPGQRFGHMPEPATGHPVIIVRRLSPSSSHVLVTTVSAYGSGEFNNFLPPWKNPRQSRHKPTSFRSFEGCELYRGPGCANRLALRLRAGSSFPKPETSWVNIQGAFVVPVTVLGVFTKARQGRSVRLLQMDPGSLKELQADMAKRCDRWIMVQKMLHGHEKSAVPSRANWQAPLPSTTTVAAKHFNSNNNNKPSSSNKKPVPFKPKAKMIQGCEGILINSWAAIAAR